MPMVDYRHTLSFNGRPYLTLSSVFWFQRQYDHNANIMSIMLTFCNPGYIENEFHLNQVCPT